MQVELDFEPEEKFQKQYNKLKDYIDKLEYSTKQKNILIDYYFKTFIDIIENGKFTTKEVTPLIIEDFFVNLGEWQEIRNEIEMKIENHIVEMVDSSKVGITLSKKKCYEEDSHWSLMITYHKKIEEKYYDNAIEKLIDDINKIYYKEKREFDQLKRKFEDDIKLDFDDVLIRPKRRLFGNNEE